MSEEISNDNNVVAVPVGEPEPHGQAAILLVESLLHALIERKLITVAEAVDLVEVAIDVMQDNAGDIVDTPATWPTTLDLLRAISNSLRIDLADR